MKAYKGFNENMTCRGFQYEEGKIYHEKDAILCEKGFHACENPLDTFNYYAPANSVYREVDAERDAAVADLRWLVPAWKWDGQKEEMKSEDD